MKKNKERFEKILPFNVSAEYAEIYRDSPANTFDSHAHEECEIYVNISGDVSFAVENSIYPISPGDIIITRPYEYHHCIYNSNKLHKHFWILFSAAGNEYLFDTFYKRSAGEGNLLTLPQEDTDALIELCHKMTEPEPNWAAKYYNFFKFINLLQNATAVTRREKSFPDDIGIAIDYISKNFTVQLTVSDIAKKANVSINTLERHFAEVFDMSPSSYIKKKRLANAARLLSEGNSVAEASEQSGFSDYSNFISHFKKHYGTTPFKYKKALTDNH